MKILRQPESKYIYEFVVAKKIDSENYLFLWQGENGSFANRLAYRTDSAVFHNVRIRGKKLKKDLTKNS